MIFSLLVRSTREWGVSAITLGPQAVHLIRHHRKLINNTITSPKQASPAVFEPTVIMVYHFLVFRPINISYFKMYVIHADS